jgi:glucosamine--fructose-6-phosphate aminotransferase (isomerizing)
MKGQPGKHTYREITTQGSAWEATLGSLDTQLARLQDWSPSLVERPEILFTGCGSTYYLSLSAAALWRKLASLPARACPASELWLYPEYVLPHNAGLGQYDCSQLVAVSRSGETTETLRAMQVFRARSERPALAISCYPENQLANLAGFCLCARGAEEESVAQTRSFTSMFLLTQVLALSIAGRSDLLEKLKLLPVLFLSLLEKYETLVRGLAESTRFERFVFLGSAANYGLACEAMLKMKEMSLSPSEAFHFLEFRHGPKSVVAPGTLVIGLVDTEMREQEGQVLAEMRALGAGVLAITETGQGIPADFVVELRSGLDSAIDRVLALPPLQLLAYYRSLHNGLDPDHPAHLDSVVKL